MPNPPNPSIVHRDGLSCGLPSVSRAKDWTRCPVRTLAPSMSSVSFLTHPGNSHIPSSSRGDKSAHRTVPQAQATSGGPSPTSNRCPSLLHSPYSTVAPSPCLRTPPAAPAPPGRTRPVPLDQTPAPRRAAPPSRTRRTQRPVRRPPAPAVRPIGRPASGRVRGRGPNKITCRTVDSGRTSRTDSCNNTTNTEEYQPHSSLRTNQPERTNEPDGAAENEEEGRVCVCECGCECGCERERECGCGCECERGCGCGCVWERAWPCGGRGGGPGRPRGRGRGRGRTAAGR